MGPGIPARRGETFLKQLIGIINAEHLQKWIKPSQLEGLLSFGEDKFDTRNTTQGNAGRVGNQAPS
jgi:hypothetical protein